MKLLLKSLKLSNFKGVKQFELMLNNTETKVFGANGTGKTTIADAFFFIFSGNDSTGMQAKEWIQTLDGENNKVHKVGHEAEVIIQVDEDTITLSRKVAEKWTKPRGQKEEVLAETLDYAYFIDGVSTPAKQFEKFLLETVFAGKFTALEFNLLCDPTAFCRLDWKKQREILYKICGNVSDEDAIATDERFNFLLDALKHKDVETYKASIRKSIKDTKKEIDDLEAVIKDRKNSLIKEYDRQEVLSEKASKEEYVISLQDKLKASDEKYQEVRKKQQEVLKIEQQLEEAKKEYFKKCNAEVDAAKDALILVETAIFNTTLNRDRAAKEKETAKHELKIIEGSVMPAFRTKWQQAIEERNKAKDLQIDESKKICPHCGQELPEDKFQEVLEKFEKSKQMAVDKAIAELEKLKAESVKIKADQQEKERIITESNERFNALDKEIESLNQKKDSLNAVISAEHEVKPFDDKEYLSKIETLRNEIKAFESIDNSKLNEELQLAQKDLQIIAVKIHKCDEYDKSQQLIEAKETERREKQLILADLETKLMNTEDFVTTKVRMLEEKVNGYFETVKFKLFKQNMKGNWEETCTALAVGANGALVDLKSGLANTALRVQAGIEICKALQKHFDYVAPIIVDNRESVTELPETDGQLISLIVSENDKRLRVE